MIANKQIQDYFSKMAHAQEQLLEYLCSDSNRKEDFNNFINSISNIRKKKSIFKVFLCLFSTISNNHHRNQYFISKIELIIKKIKPDINHFFSNLQILNIFRKNKLILLILHEQKIITLERNFFSGTFDKYEYYAFFSPEISNGNDLYKKDPDLFLKNRKIGESEFYFCKLIRDDLIDEFVTFVNNKQTDLSSTIHRSIFETNLLLIKTSPTIIEYAAFYGSIKIFKFLCEKNVKIYPSIWKYAIHGQNQEILEFLQQKVNITNEIEKCMKESIKSHDIQRTLFMYNNFVTNEINSKLKVYLSCIKAYNFIFLLNEKSNGVIIFNDFLDDYVKTNDDECDNNDKKVDVFFYLCKYDYFDVVDILFKVNKNNFYVNMIHMVSI